jgi:hypothetical protein
LSRALFHKRGDNNKKQEFQISHLAEQPPPPPSLSCCTAGLENKRFFVIVLAELRADEKDTAPARLILLFARLRKNGNGICTQRFLKGTLVSFPKHDT